MVVPEFKLCEKAVELSEYFLHAVGVVVEISQRLVSGDVTYLLKAAGEIFG